MAEDAVNGISVAEVIAQRERARTDPASAERGSTVKAIWKGGDRSVVECGSIRLGVQGPDELGPMQLVQAALASCVVDVVATRAALEGIELEDLSVEVSGSFDARAYLGLEDAPRPGYGALSCTVQVRASGASPDQIEGLRLAAERGSPVGDTLARAIPLTVTFRSD